VATELHLTARRHFSNQTTCGELTPDRPWRAACSTEENRPDVSVTYAMMLSDIPCDIPNTATDIHSSLNERRLSERFLAGLARKVVMKGLEYEPLLIDSTHCDSLVYPVTWRRKYNQFPKACGLTIQGRWTISTVRITQNINALHGKEGEFLISKQVVHTVTW
jgi:hypothetical protein